MKTRKRTYLTMLFIVLVSCAMAQNTNTMGTDFWVAFMDNVDTVPRSQCLSIFAASERTCTLTITNPNTGWSQSMTVSPNSNNRLFVPLAQGYTTASAQVTNTGFHVYSSDTVSLYTITLGNPSVEYTCVLPTPMLGSDYMIQSFPADRYSSEFTIVATEDNTVVDIALNGNTDNGHTSGQTITVTFPLAGKAYPLKSAVPGDLSGTRVTARNNKKIAVFHGDACAYIPDWNTGRSCDHVVEQAIPTQYWGREFIVPASHSPRADYVRVTALDDNCAVTLNGNTVTTLATGRTYQYTMSSNSTIDYIQTSMPALVNVYFPSTDGHGYGDPSMLTVAPIEQSLSYCRYPIITTSNIYEHYTHIICRSSATGSIYVDGTNRASSFSSISNAPGYSYARLNMLEGIHSIASSDTNGYIAYITGSGSRVSYGYCLGYACKDLRAPSLLADGVNTDLTSDGLDRCADDTVRFSVISPDSIIYVRWLLNGATYSTNWSLNHCFHDTGTFSVCALVNFMMADDPTIYRDTFCTTVRVHPQRQHYIDDTCVENQLPYILRSHIYLTDTVDTLRYTTVHGCDSTVYFTLKVWRNDSIRFDTVVCDTLLPFTWHGLSFPRDTSITLRFTNQHKADSIITYTLDTVTCRLIITYCDTIVCDTILPYDWHGVTFLTDSTVTMRYNAMDNSDSLVVYALYTTECRPPLSDDSLYIWVPNVFTPGRDENNRFRIFCSDVVTEATVAIYQHWGDFVTRFDGLTESWNGTFKGSPCQQGTYVYLISYRIGNSRKMNNMFGSVTLLR